MKITISYIFILITVGSFSQNIVGYENWKIIPSTKLSIGKSFYDISNKDCYGINSISNYYLGIESHQPTTTTSLTSRGSIFDGILSAHVSVPVREIVNDTLYQNLFSADFQMLFGLDIIKGNKYDICFFWGLGYRHIRFNINTKVNKQDIIKEVENDFLLSAHWLNRYNFKIGSKILSFSLRCGILADIFNSGLLSKKDRFYPVFSPYMQGSIGYTFKNN